jgi:CHAD domain-containing protein
MAKAKEINGLDCAAEALEWVTAILRTRLEEVTGLRGVALNFADIEGVHDMRVATRRLRGAIHDFLPLMNKRPLKQVRKDLKQLADALGAVRDHDVAIAALEKLRDDAEETPIKEGLGKMLEERRTQRELAQFDLVEALAISKINLLDERFTKAIDKAVKKKTAENASFNDVGQRVVGELLQEFCDLSDSIYSPFINAPLHKFRISAKHLRYALELFAPCWDNQSEPFAVEIAEMQSSLGEIHDCDIWIENLSKRLLQNKLSLSEDQARTWLLGEYVKTRTKNYRDALKLWNKWKAEGFIEKLKTLISQPVLKAKAQTN